MRSNSHTPALIRRVAFFSSIGGCHSTLNSIFGSDGAVKSTPPLAGGASGGAGGGGGCGKGQREGEVEGEGESRQHNRLLNATFLKN